MPSLFITQDEKSTNAPQEWNLDRDKAGQTLWLDSGYTVVDIKNKYS